MEKSQRSQSQSRIQRPDPFHIGLPQDVMFQIQLAQQMSAQGCDNVGIGHERRRADDIVIDPLDFRKKIYPGLPHL